MEMLTAPGIFLTAQWRWLAMLNYEVDPAVLMPRVPEGTELDNWNGKTFVSIVGFRFLETRLFGVAVPFHRAFDEVNLRFYVRRRAPDGWRRGETRLPDEGSLESFLVEHYWGYTSRRRGGSSEYRVEHPRWKLWAGTAVSLQCQVGRVYGPEYVAPAVGEPGDRVRRRRLNRDGAPGCAGGVSSESGPETNPKAARLLRRAVLGRQRRQRLRNLIDVVVVGRQACRVTLLQRN